MTIRGVLGAIGCAIISGFMVLVVVSMISMVCTGKAHGQSYRWPDYGTLQGLGVNPRVALAVAWEETAANIDPKVRGHHCWYSVRIDSDDWVLNAHEVVVRRTDALWLVHHEQNCEVGRFQIKPSTARLRCPGLDVFTYGGNLACFAQMFAADAKTRGTLYAIRHHNGAGPRADAYVQRVLRTVGWLTVTEGP